MRLAAVCFSVVDSSALSCGGGLFGVVGRSTISGRSASTVARSCNPEWSSQDLVETLSKRLVSGLELLRTDAAEMAVAACRIVEAVDVVSNVRDGQLPVLVDLFLDALFLQAAEERLGDSVVPAVAFAAHAGFQVIGAAESPPCVAAVLGALIGMNQGSVGSSPSHRRQHGIEHELAVNRWPSRPADDLAREEIHDDGEVQPALPRPNIGDIGHPRGVWPRGSELPLQEIRDEERRLADSPAPNAIPMQRAHIVLAHQASDTMLTAGFSRLSQIEEDAGSAINAMARDERCANQSKQSGVFLIVVRNRLLQPKVVAADRHPRTRHIIWTLY